MSPWNKEELERQCGSFFAATAAYDQGNPQLTNPKSIMRFDRPGSLASSGCDERYGGFGLDNEAIVLLRKLYPTLIDAYSNRVSATQAPGWSGGIKVPAARVNCRATQTTKGVTGLCRLDMGLHGNFRISTSFENVVQRSSFDVVINAWHDTHIIDATCSALTFDEADQRVQTGCVGVLDMRRPDDPKTGVPFWIDIPFSRPFKNTPQVVTFLSMFDTEHGKQIRLKTYASEISRNGFRLNLATWDGKLCPLSSN
jgi:hypothetical protein